MFKLPSLDYKYDGLEPVIDAKTMEIHHNKHHQGYVDKLNKTLENHPELQKKSLEDLVKEIDKLPEEIKDGVRKAGGGHYNHSLYWEIMGEEKGQPEGKLLEAIKKEFGGVEEFKTRFSEAAKGLFGSGWAWLSAGQGRLWICSTSNQDSCLMRGVVKCSCNRQGEGYPILGIDVWEHAYYLKYQNRRAEYVDNFWQVVNWKKVAERYETGA